MLGFIHGVHLVRHDETKTEKKDIHHFGSSEIFVTDFDKIWQYILCFIALFINFGKT